jgi:hypothetical protein
MVPAMAGNEVTQIQTTKEQRIGVGLSCALAAAMLAWPVFGSPPYGYFGAMKLVVALVSVLGALTLYQMNKLFLPLCILLVASGGIELFGKMRREEWAPFNWAGLSVLAIASAICIFARSRGLIEPTDPASGGRGDV